MTVSPSPHRFCVAPMMGCTDRHARYLLRLLSRRARLYTEMIPVGALLHGDAERALRFDPAEHPVAIQLGGSDPADLARCARRAERAGYDEVNLNVGCPSPRVQRGSFGAALMARPALVAECVAAMRDAVSMPVTVKTRIGIDDLDSYARFRDFAGAVAEAGCSTFIVHARKAWLSGLSPRQNREVPPLRHDRVYRLKREMRGLEIVLNGGITNLEEAQAALRRVDGVMLGRAAWHDLWLLAGSTGPSSAKPPRPRSGARWRHAISPTRSASAERASGSWCAPSSACTEASRAPAGGGAPSASSPTVRTRPWRTLPRHARAFSRDRRPGNFGRREAGSGLRAGPRRLRHGTAPRAGGRDGRPPRTAGGPRRGPGADRGRRDAPGRFSEDEPRLRRPGRDGA